MSELKRYNLPLNIITGLRINTIYGDTLYHHPAIEMKEDKILLPPSSRAKTLYVKPSPSKMIYPVHIHMLVDNYQPQSNIIVCFIHAHLLTTDVRITPIIESCSFKDYENAPNSSEVYLHSLEYVVDKIETRNYYLLNFKKINASGNLKHRSIKNGGHTIRDLQIDHELKNKLRRLRIKTLKQLENLMRRYDEKKMVEMSRVILTKDDIHSLKMALDLLKNTE
ncbi:MAG: hypothetical protein NZM04_05605 [Methylacidiphilales bacterium]|nr:hypothetical protein [Candidatus Methylacidiphilales bacterium]